MIKKPTKALAQVRLLVNKHLGRENRSKRTEGGQEVRVGEFLQKFKLFHLNSEKCECKPVEDGR